MNRTAVEQIKERIPIEELVGSYVKLEKAGKSFKAKCPFHNEKTASFFVSPERGGYYCFGCGAKGDIFSFVEQFEGLDFRGALKILAERAGVKLVFDQKADSDRDRLFKIMEEAAQFFESQFEKSKEAQEYIKSRGVSEKTRKEFRVGWAPEGWRNLSDHLKKKGWNDSIMEKAGLIKKNERKNENPPSRSASHPLYKGEPTQSIPPWKGGTPSASEDGGILNTTPSFYDRFRGRIMFPITDSGGRVVAFSGRILKDDGKSAKYLNSPDTPLYDKSLILYGLDKAKGEIRRMGYSIFVEGQMDLIMSHQAGIKNTVAASGTALSDETVNESGVVSNLSLVRRLSPNMIIAFDSDLAGRKAALRAAGIALSMGMDVKIADIVGGKDPADLVKEDVEKWKNVLRAGKPVIEFELDNVLREIPDSRKIPRALRERVFPFLARLTSEMDKAHFVKMIADRAKISDDAVWQDLRAVEKTIQGEGYRVKGEENSNSSHSTSPLTPHPSPSSVHHIDLVERRMFGLLNLMEMAKRTEAAGYREEIKKIAGVSYENRLKRIEPLIADLSFEAEAFWGNDTANWDRHMKELISNFEEDILNEELMTSLAEVRNAEKSGDHVRLAELAKKYQELSVRKAEVGKKRRV